MARDNPEQTPEGKLIEEAAKASGRSARQLAANAGMSDTRWRQVVRGQQPGPKGDPIAVKAPSLTLARMAQATGVSAEQLEEVGRDDAATALRGLSVSSSGPGGFADAPGDEIDMIYASRSMTAEEKLRAIRKVLHLRAQVEQGQHEEAAAERTDALDGR